MSCCVTNTNKMREKRISENNNRDKGGLNIISMYYIYTVCVMMIYWQ